MQISILFAHASTISKSVAPQIAINADILFHT